MANIPADLLYSTEHEWVRLEGKTATIGVTDYAQEQLTDIVFVELPEIGRIVKSGEAVAVLESVKSVSDVYAPTTGEITGINEELENHPERINEDAFGEGWIYKMKTTSNSLPGLMDAAAYEAFLKEQG